MAKFFPVIYPLLINLTLLAAFFIQCFSFSSFTNFIILLGINVFGRKIFWRFRCCITGHCFEESSNFMSFNCFDENWYGLQKDGKNAEGLCDAFVSSTLPILFPVETWSSRVFPTVPAANKEESLNVPNKTIIGSAIQFTLL